MSREFEVCNFDDYTDEELDDLLDEFTNIIIDIKRERGIEEEDDSRENIKTIYLDDWFTNYMFEDEMKSRDLDLNTNFKEEAIGNLGDWLPINYITNWEDIKSLLNKVSVELIRKKYANSKLTNQWWKDIGENQLLGDYFESKGEIDWQGGGVSDFGQYTFYLKYESDKENNK
jgi:hypothetical protein